MELSIALILIIAASNFLLTVSRLGLFLPVQQTSTKYNYLGQNYPIEAPIGPLSPVEMTFQESIRFSLGANNFSQDWHAYDGKDPNRWVFGHVWLGPHKSPFVPVLNHQLHCLRFVVESLDDLDRGLYGSLNDIHVEHCLNYMRQTLLCRADDYLESGDFMSQDFEFHRIEDTRVCKDWSQIFSWVADENAKWMPL